VQPETAKLPASAAAPSGGPSLSDWRSQVIGILKLALRKLERKLDAIRDKRYPPVNGAVQLAFTINQQGRITSPHLDRSSGSAALHAEALALVRRVSIPPPPAEIQTHKSILWYPTESHPRRWLVRHFNREAVQPQAVTRVGNTHRRRFTPSALISASMSG
jgi:TonB family protein